LIEREELANVARVTTPRFIHHLRSARAMVAALVLGCVVAGGGCTNTSNNASPGTGGSGPGPGGGGGGQGNGSGNGDGGMPVGDGGPDAGPPGGYLWFAGAELSGFTQAQTVASNTDGPGIIVSPSAMTATFHDLVFDPDGNLWTLPIAGDKVLMIASYDLVQNSRPVPILAISSTALKAPQALAFDDAGNLWVVSYNGTSSSVATIVRFDGVRGMTGGDVTLTPSLTIGPGTDATMINQFTQGTALAFDTAGSLWFGASAGVMRFDQPANLQGTVTAAPATIVSTGESYLSMAFDAAGSLWVTGSKSGFFVLRFANPGALSGKVTPTPAAKVAIPAGTGTQMARFAGGLAFDADGSLWIAMSNQIISIASPGALSGNVTASPSIVLGLPATVFPDLTSKLAFWPMPAGVPVE
jgi:ligand-binding sensor domain-containing protein